MKSCQSEDLDGLQLIQLLLELVYLRLFVAFCIFGDLSEHPVGFFHQLLDHLSFAALGILIFSLWLLFFFLFLPIWGIFIFLLQASCTLSFTLGLLLPFGVSERRSWALVCKVVFSTAVPAPLLVVNLVLPLAIFALLTAVLRQEETANVSGSGILAFPFSFVSSTSLLPFELLQPGLLLQGVLLSRGGCLLGHAGVGVKVCYLL